ncbi:methylated-DNA--[protein]-cysteine S-methyltransferase [Hymenobacter lucidus]|uniref:Methylated-DNA--protein-cysteine methyltransferase n=1 Tax=Hymenobacter lucidus TaxID=2880930 RepID=A0ABS8AK91_9BACT|nr:methylated-DNA--[protein]-cysteine S-methyltransferase [Hymenobacter lucidus]MCB2406610.1 methylated-DNA--[protein]-cysteine S-methyltransferase [Hymenobacter lucidus]
MLLPSAFAYSYLPTPIGMLELKASDAGLAAVTFLDEAQAPPATPLAAVAECLREPHRQLQAYFGRELRDFSLRYSVERGTEFQRQVWQQLQTVSFGRTASYLDLARLLDNPGAVRAVGAANGQNPLAIVWPCHRIIGAGGQLTGYAGGLSRKKWLLTHEQPATQTQLFG